MTRQTAARFVASSLAVLIGLTLAASPAAAQWTGEPTALDGRRLALLHAVDANFKPDGSEAAAPQPNLKLKPAWSEHYYLEDALAILSLIEAGEAPAGRAAEANQALRFMLWNWPTNGGSVVGQYPAAWNHRSRSLAVRLYIQFRDQLEPDIRAEWEARMATMVTDPFTSKSENIKMTNTSAIFLAHEVLGHTDLPSYTASRDWLRGYLTQMGAGGMHEFGSAYQGWTLGSVLNLADFAADDDVRDLATLVIDMYSARQAAFSVDGSVANGGVRRYGHSTHGAYMPQTTILRALYDVGAPFDDFFGNNTAVEWGQTNYRPLAAVAELYANTAPLTADMTVGHDWRYRTWRNPDVSLTTSQSTDADHFVLPSGGTHDIVGLYVQSSRSGNSQVTVWGYPLEPIENGPKKRRCRVERYFGHQNIAFAHHGGTTNAVWAGGVFTQIPIRLWYSLDFAVELEGGWAFLDNGKTWVAWAPTVGDPLHQTEALASDKAGRFLVSSHHGDDQGEVAVVEVGDAASHGSYANFKSGILGRGRPRWQNGEVSWTAIDGKTVRFTATDVFVDGQRYEPTSHPAARAPGLDGFTIGTGPGAVTIDFQGRTWSGSTARLPAHFVFPGASGAPVDPDEPAPRCADGLDNDGDGAVDYPADVGCAGSWDDDETNPAPNDPTDPDPPATTACTDHLDNDGDGLVDLADPDCADAADDDERGTVIVVPVDPETGEARLVALPAEGEITIDGDHTEFVGSGTWTGLGLEGWQSPLDTPWTGLSAQMAVRWSPQGLYFAIAVEDAHHSPVSSATGGAVDTMWQGDSVQLGLDLNFDGGDGYTGDDRELTLGQVDGQTAVHVFHGRTDPALVQLAIARDGSTTRYELFVPATELGDLVLRDGLHLGFSFLVNDAGDAAGPTGRLGWIEWTHGIGWTKAPESWGELVLQTLQMPAQPDDPATPDDPTDPDVEVPGTPDPQGEATDPDTLDPVDGTCGCTVRRDDAPRAPLWLALVAGLVGLGVRRRRAGA